MVDSGYIIVSNGDYQVKVEFDEERIFIEKIDWFKGQVRCERIERVDKDEIKNKTKILGRDIVRKKNC